MKRLVRTFAALLPLIIVVATVMALPASASTGAAVLSSHYYITGKDGTRLYVEEFGQGSPVILLSGGPGLNPGYLKPVYEHLAKYHRVVVLNERGTGKSVVAVVNASTMSMDNYVGDLEALRAHLGQQKLVLIGHSWGGMLAMLYLSRMPEHVSKLVLLDSGGLTKKFLKELKANILAKLTKSDRAMLKRAQETNDRTLALKAMTPGIFTIAIGLWPFVPGLPTHLARKASTVTRSSTILPTPRQ